MCVHLLNFNYTSRSHTTTRSLHMNMMGKWKECLNIYNSHILLCWAEVRCFFFVSLFCVAGWLVISGIKPSAANIYVREKKNACATTIADRAVLCVNLYVCAPQQTYTHICTYTTNKEQNIYTEIHKIIATAETANALSAGVNVFILIYLSLEIHIQLHWMVFF